MSGLVSLGMYVGAITNPPGATLILCNRWECFSIGSVVDLHSPSAPNFREWGSQEYTRKVTITATHVEWADSAQKTGRARPARAEPPGCGQVDLEIEFIDLQWCK